MMQVKFQQECSALYMHASAATLKPLDLIRVEDNPDIVAYAPWAASDAIEFYVIKPFDQ